MGIFSRSRRLLLTLPISYRIAVGNAIVITIGAIGGTLITRHLADNAAHWWLIIFFISAGTLLSVATNFWIIKNALRPLRELSTLVVQVQAGLSSIDPRFLADTDPDINQLAAALNNLVKQLDERNRQLRALSERVINAQEDERKRIALALHDDTGQMLSLLLIHLEKIEDLLSNENPELINRLASAHGLASRSLAELRKIIHGLRPSILDDLGLVSAIRWYARSNLEEAGIRAQIKASEEALPLSPQVNSALFRIAQEAINNIVRHSHARSVNLQLYKDNGDYCLTIEDDGCGFEVGKIFRQAVSLQHLGLLAMQERAELVGGKLRIESDAGKGTRLHVRVPSDSRGES